MRSTLLSSFFGSKRDRASLEGTAVTDNTENSIERAIDSTVNATLKTINFAIVCL
ncbi:MAG: hypothetical protein HC941_11550 [Microcoleus sp. SU_5_3]|nr:hypothetical protein [Microcoleus sp. SU_5_3]